MLYSERGRTWGGRGGGRGGIRGREEEIGAMRRGREPEPGPPHNPKRRRVSIQRVPIKGRDVKDER